MKRTQHCFCNIPTKDALLESNHEETANKPTAWGILQNNQLVIFKGITEMKVKGRMKNCSKLKETKET